MSDQTDRSALLFISKPAGGKGTQSTLLRDNFGFSWISSSELLKAKRGDQTDSDTAQEIAQAMDNNDLVSDKVMNGLVGPAISDSQGNLVLDGLSRTIVQHLFLLQSLSKAGISRLHAILIDVTDHECHRRMIERNRQQERWLPGREKRLKGFTTVTMAVWQEIVQPADDLGIAITNDTVVVGGEGDKAEIHQCIVRSLQEVFLLPAVQSAVA